MAVFYNPALDMYIDVDAQRYGNETRFINDFRGVDESPNVSFCQYIAPATGEMAVGIITSRALQAGSELLADYGNDFDEYSTGKR